MTDFSEFVIFFLMLPLVIQILIPLLMLVGFGLLCAVKMIFGGEKVVRGVQKYFQIPDKFQLRRS